ncbi:MAG: translation initiation factor IF-2 subunit beta [Candidatus Bathyarchaeia archaeon]|nr:translation initiation factor IF-2 subunit beta [Candidatus Bathyarchaeota archaeon]
MRLERDYGALLERALRAVPKRDRGGKRFEVPDPIVNRVGNKTLILNFQEISSRMNRDPRHLIKFVSKELATAGSLEEARAVFQGRFSDVTIRRLMEIYIKRYVICPICKGPDTSIVREGRFNFLVCEACGAKSSIVE